VNGLHTVHLRVNDAATGEPTPVRVRFADEQGNYLPPFGRPERVAATDPWGGSVKLDAGWYAAIDGSCEILLPADPVKVEITKGFEYRPILRDVTLGTGKLALRFAIERWADLRAERWYSGDTSVLGLVPHAALLEGAAEDVAVVNLLAADGPTISGNSDESASNLVAFSGQKPALEMSGHLVAVNTWNCATILGGLGLLNCHRVVFPLTSGQYSDLDWTLEDWCGQCHRKGGLVLWCNFGSGWQDTANDGYSGETLANLVLGNIDAVEMTRLGWLQSLQKEEWYRLLNCDIRAPLAGGTFRVRNLKAIGGIRTYARLLPGEEFNYKNWIEAVRAGRTFVTNGPLLTLTVNDQDPGAVIDLAADTPRKVRIRAEARSILPFERLELVLNGDAMAAVEASGDPAAALLEGEFEVPGTCWLAARCWGPQPAFASSSPRDTVGAHTSPVYVRVGERPAPADMISLALLIERLDRMLNWVEKEARFDGERTRKHLTETLHAARTILVGRMPA
jgi:hypothetical protein